MLSWQWQLDGTLDTSVPAAVYDIDGFDATSADVSALHARGRRVICYISAGTWENWRPDAGLYSASALGKDDAGWPGERWVDIRQIDVIGPILERRLDMCQAKGFDGVEPDNIDSYEEDTGFPLTAADQTRFNTWLAAQAHQRGLSIGLKNDPDQAAALVPFFDWALTEDCFAQGWCDQMAPFVRAGKSVFAAEYTDTGMTTGQFCARARAMGFSGLLKRRDLGAWAALC